MEACFGSIQWPPRSQLLIDGEIELEADGIGIFDGFLELLHPRRAEESGAGGRLERLVAASAHVEHQHAAETGILHGAEFGARRLQARRSR